MKNFKVPVIVSIFALLLAPLYSNANGTTYVDSCGVSSSADYETLVVTSDILGAATDYTCILITHQHVTLDCQGYYVTGTSGGLSQGIVVDDSGNFVTIKRCKLLNWFQSIVQKADDGLIDRNEAINGGWGIILSLANNNDVRRNRVENQSWDGIAVVQSHNNFFWRNRSYNNPARGILLDGSFSNDLVNNRFQNNSGGIYLAGSNENNIVDNASTLNESWGIRLAGSYDNIVTNNRVMKNEVGIEEQGEELNNIYEDNICINNNTDSNVPYACD